MKETAPLLSSPAQHVSRRTLAAATAVLLGCVVLAITTASISLSRSSRPVIALQQKRASYVAQLAPPVQSAQPIVYVPVIPQQGLAAGPAANGVQPQVYYLAPQPVGMAPQLAGMKVFLGQSLNGTGNSTNSTDGDSSDDGEFSCTVANLVAESAKVQTAWDKCLKNPRYEEPNKGAGGRRLLGWVWEPDSAPQKAAGNWIWEPARPRGMHGSYQLALRHSMLAGNGTNGTDGGAEEDGDDGDSLMDSEDVRSMSECMQEAIGDSCENIDDCDDSVCKHYYNEPEIEALCGICHIAAANDWGPFGSWRSAELWLVLLIFLTVVVAVPIIICECCWRRRKPKEGY